MANKIFSRLKNYMVYRGGAHWKYNTYSENNSEKFQRWKQFISDYDRDNIETIEGVIQNLLKQNPKYTLSLIAHGSSTYGKSDYSDIDLILEPSNGDIRLYEELWKKLKPSFDISFQGGFYLNGDWTLEFNLANLFHSQGKPIQIGYRTNIFMEEYTKPLNGSELITALRRKKTPHIGIFLDNKKI